ncbi:MAG: hypothetical protein WDM76_04900 [Limisphaerales bacterium]
MLSIVGGLLLFSSPRGRRLEILAALYGVGLALTFDEFGMWLHLGGSYWQRASWDAVSVIGGGLLLFAYAPTLAKFRPLHWWVTVLLICAFLFFSFLIKKSFRYAEHVAMPKLLQIEAGSPQ